MNKHLPNIDAAFQQALNNFTETPPEGIWNDILAALDELPVKLPVQRIGLRFTWQMWWCCLCSVCISLPMQRINISLNNPTLQVQTVEKDSLNVVTTPVLTKSKLAQMPSSKSTQQPISLQENITKLNDTIQSNRITSSGKSKNVAIGNGKTPYKINKKASVGEQKLGGTLTNSTPLPKNTKQKKFITIDKANHFNKNTTANLVQSKHSNKRAFTQLITKKNASLNAGSTIANEENGTQYLQNNSPNVPPISNPTLQDDVFNRQLQPISTSQKVDISNKLSFQLPYLGNLSATIGNLKNAGLQSKNKTISTNRKWPVVSLAAFYNSEHFQESEKKERRHRDIRNPNDERAQIRTNQQTIQSNTFGVLGSLQWSKRWSMQSGISFFQQETTLGKQMVKATPNNQGEYFFKYNFAAGYANLKVRTNIAANDTILVVGGTNKLSYIGIPLQFSYHIPLGKIAVVLTNGVTFQMLQNGSLSTKIADGAGSKTFTDKKIGGLKRHFITGSIGLGVGYRLMNNLQLSLTPNYRFSYVPINKGTVVLSKPTALGIGCNIQYSFK